MSSLVSLGSGVSIGASVGASIAGGSALTSISSQRADTGGIYGHLTELELVELRDQVVSYIKLVLKGESIINVSIGGKSVSKNLPTIEELKSELNEIKNTLKALDPITYGKKRRRFGFDHRLRKR